MAGQKKKSGGSSAAPPALYLGVKFYAADPCRLRDEVTRYQFFLQLRSDALQGRLPAPRRETAAELAGYVLQCESAKLPGLRVSPPPVG